MHLSTCPLPCHHAGKTLPGVAALSDAQAPTKQATPETTKGIYAAMVEQGNIHGLVDKLQELFKSADGKSYLFVSVLCFFGEREGGRGGGGRLFASKLHSHLRVPHPLWCVPTRVCLFPPSRLW